MFGVDPSHGPFTGGGHALVVGKGFTPDVRVWFGPVEANGIIAIDPTHVQVDVPPGTAGPADVAVQNDDDSSTRRTLVAGYSYDSLYAVPSTGPVAGGTVISILGQSTAWDASSEAAVDNKPCTSLTVVSPSELSCIVPQGTPGAKAIRVSTGDETLLVLDAYTYEDSSDGFKGGLGGEPLDGQLTVLVFDDNTGDPLPGAFVVAGESLTTGLVTQTNSSGMATFDDASLTDAITVTVAALCHSPISFVDVPVDTVTSYLDPTLTPECASQGDSLPAGGKPVEYGSATGELVWEGGVEFQKAPWTNIPAPLGAHEKRVAYLFVASTNPGRDFKLPAESAAVFPDSAGDVGYGFNLALHPGNHTLYAIAGIQNDGTGVASFTGYAFGTVQGVNVEPGVATGPVYISMASALDQALTLDVSPPPLTAKGPDRLHATVAIEIAQQRYAILPGGQKTVLLPLTSQLTFVGLPPLDGPLTGSRYISAGEAATTTALSPPLSAVAGIASISTSQPVDLTGFVAVPKLVSPTPGGAWDGRHLAVEYPEGGWPVQLTVYEISAAGGLIRWTIAVPAADHAIELLDIAGLPEVEVPLGPLVIGTTGGRITDFDYTKLRYGDLRPSGMSAHSLDYFNAHR